MSITKTVEQELLGATEQREKGKKENLAQYLSRVATAVSDLKDPEYMALSKGSQAWFTQAAAALSEEPPAPEKIEEFENFDAQNVKEKKKEDPSPSSTAKDKKKGKKDAEESKKTDKPEGKKKKDGDQPSTTKTTSIADTIRFAMCSNPAVTKEDVAKVLKEKRLSFDQSRLDQVYSATARVLQILQELNKL